MLDRYSRKEAKKIWSLENTYQIWLDIEIAVCKAYNKLGQISDEDLAVIEKKANFDLARIAEIEKETQHDILAFLSCVSEYINHDAARFVHLGLTSSDVKDSALSIQIKQSTDLIIETMDRLLKTLQELAIKHKKTICIGRSHGIHAEPTSFGLKILNFYQDMKTARDQIQSASEKASVVMFSGAVGTYANIDPEIEKISAEILGLKPTNVSTQVISRDRHAHFVNSLAVMASSLEKITTEIRHLQRTDVLEVEEPFYEGQKGSSAMPHKRNPWKSENISGLARLMRSYSGACLENIVLWHERDMSHSSVERVALVDACILADFMLDRVEKILAGLNVYEKNMEENLYKFGGVIFSQQVLLELVKKGMQRDDAYKIVQVFAHEAWNTPSGNFRELIESSDQISQHLTKEDIESCFDAQKHLSNVDKIFDNVLEKAVA